MNCGCHYLCPLAALVLKKKTMVILMQVPVLVNEVCVLYVCLLGMERGLAGNWYEDFVLQGVLQGAGALIYEP